MLFLLFFVVVVVVVVVVLSESFHCRDVYFSMEGLRVGIDRDNQVILSWPPCLGINTVL